jgi:hypothetical protein
MSDLLYQSSSHFSGSPDSRFVKLSVSSASTQLERGADKKVVWLISAILREISHLQ